MPRTNLLLVFVSKSKLVVVGITNVFFEKKSASIFFKLIHNTILDALSTNPALVFFSDLAVNELAVTNVFLGVIMAPNELKLVSSR